MRDRQGKTFLPKEAYYDCDNEASYDFSNVCYINQQVYRQHSTAPLLSRLCHQTN